MTEIPAGDLGRLLDLGRLDLLVSQHAEEIRKLRDRSHELSGAVQRIDGALGARVEAHGEEIERLRERWREHQAAIAANDARGQAVDSALNEQVKDVSERTQKLETLTHITPRVDRLEEAMEKLTAILIGDSPAQDGGVAARLVKQEAATIETKEAFARMRWIGALVVAAVVAQAINLLFTLLRPHP